MSGVGGGFVLFLCGDMNLKGGDAEEFIFEILATLSLKRNEGGNRFPGAPSFLTPLLF